MEEMVKDKKVNIAVTYQIPINFSLSMIGNNRFKSFNNFNERFFKSAELTSYFSISGFSSAFKTFLLTPAYFLSQLRPSPP